MSVESGQSPLLAVRVLWTDPVEFPAHALTRFFLHPYFLAFQLLIFLAIAVSNNGPELRSVPFAYRGLVYLLGVIATALIVYGTLWWRGRTGTGDRIAVNLTPVLFLANCAVIPVTDWIERNLFLQRDFAPLTLAVLIFFYGCMAQIGTALMLAFFGKQIVRGITDPAPEPAPQTQEPPPPAMPEPSVTIGGVTVPVAALVMVEAKGNYVEVVTLIGRHRVTGPLADRLAELPSGLGRLVHRSVWLREAAVTGFHRTGRDLIIRLLDGQSVTSAQSRRADLLPWLQSLPLDGDQASNRSA